MAAKRLIVDSHMPPPARKLLGLVQHLLHTGKTQALRAIHNGVVLVNGRPAVSAGRLLKPGDEVRITAERLGVKKLAKKPVNPYTLHFVFEDEFLVVVDKPPGLLTVPTPRRESRTLISLLQHYLRGTQPTAVACCVHRLDREVSGLLVFAKNVVVAEQMRSQFEQRKPQRKYVAIAAGIVAPPAASFRSYLATNRKTLARYSTNDTESGELAITHYRVLEVCRGQTVVEVRLETGRRHQIRVHFAEAGHAILGDERYGHHADVPLCPFWPHRRLALHAASLAFTHPVTDAKLRFVSKLPQEFIQFGLTQRNPQ